MVALFGTSAKASSTSTRKVDFTAVPGVSDPALHSQGPFLSGHNEDVSRHETTTGPLTESVHFLSLPLWKKRVQNNTSKDVNGTVNRPRPILPSNSYLVDKDLPPTPLDDTTESLRLRPSLVEQGVDRERVSSVSQTSIGLVPSVDHVHRPQSTSALAQAILDVGLPHALPRNASSSSAVNTISFTLPTSTSEVSASLSPNIRKSKSTQILGTRPSIQTSFTSSTNNRRIRGLSFGTSPFLHSPSSDSKGKEKAKDDYNNSEPRPEKKLLRKTSFWSRKRYVQTSEMPASTSSGPKELSLPFLPSVQPGSPFDMQHLLSSPSGGAADTRSFHFRGLSRSHSAREGRSDASHVVTDAMPGSQKRPSTAGATVVPRKNSRIFFHGSTNTPKTTSTFYGDRPAVFPGEEARPLPQRQRALTTPPLLHRLSLNVFQSSNPQTKLHVNTSDAPQITTLPTSKYIPKVNDDESPEAYLNRLQISVTKKEIPEILASSADSVHSKALRAYIGRFDFTDNALDIALRKLLMEVGLPHETQQIDRVIEAFASHYVHCNPSLFTSEDHPYILAFSLIMLHTDAFNKSNKHKMSKADYVKNTLLPGIAQEVLEYLYDNIVFAPFIFIEEPLESNGHSSASSASENRLSISTTTPISAVPGGNSLLSRANKVDPYYLIGNNLLDPLRVTMDAWMTEDNLYSTKEWAMATWDTLKSHDTFYGAKRIRLELTSSSCTTATGDDLPFRADFSKRQIFAMKVTKIGLLQRKDDLLEGGRRALNRKWRTWTVILAGFQLLFFRDTTLAASLLSTQLFSSDGEDIISGDILHPDELVSVKDSIAVFDRSYRKHPNTVRFALSNGRQMLLQTLEARDIDEWISKINYASTFKSTGVKLRSPTMPTLEVELTGVAAATSHLHDIQRTRFATSVRSSGSTFALAEDRTAEETSENQGSSSALDFTPYSDADLDPNIPMAPEIDGADQLKATFDLVKAELASNAIASPEDLLVTSSQRNTISNRTFPLHEDFFSTRSQVLKHKIEELEAKISFTRRRLEEAMQLVRSISVLTPFQKSTRDRLSSTMQVKANDIRGIRLELSKYSCYHSILSHDLNVEFQEWDRTRKLALRAARDTLHRRTRDNTSRMKYMTHDDDEVGSVPMISQNNTPDKPESSTCGSFHSALDFGPEWPSSHELSGNFLTMPQFMESPRLSTSESTSSFPLSNVEDPLRGLNSCNLSVEALSATTSPACTENCEQAEAWDETRYAQRVSLIRVPSGISLPVRGKMK
ncbi:hypothetical protein BDQ17DRAFT_1269079 [Cyathus striatus]|nr:hypothetical protein BDQ17DRAFT_1269079 [Cyathus striatus]